MIPYALLNMEFYRSRAALMLAGAGPERDALIVAECFCYEYQLSLRSLLIGLGLR